MSGGKQKGDNSIKDKYVHDMDWANDISTDFELSNYRKYQYDLIGKYMGKNILEVGSGDRSFTNQIVKNTKNIERLVSIEPSAVLMNLYKQKYPLPDYVDFEYLDLFDMTHETHGQFDTIILIHVLEHIEKDRDAITHLHSLLSPGGYLLIQVPALPFLYSIHDENLGHYRRYNKKNLKACIDMNLYSIKDLWFQDAIGILGSLYFFKLRKIKLKSAAGVNLVNKQGRIYDKYIIPTEKFYEKFVRLPFGLSLTCILEKK